MDGLERFRDAQDQEYDGLDAALAELHAGRKRGHWIWYVFPQLEGLGRSETARYFGLRGPQDAQAYLQDDVLRERLGRAIDAVAGQLCRLPPPRLEVLMGSRLDALKLVSSLTLFEAVAADLHARQPHPDYAQLAARAGDALAVAASQGYDRCAYTQARLAPAGS